MNDSTRLIVPQRQQHALDMVDDDVVAQLIIRVHRSGALSIAGDIHEETFAMACCDHAKQAVKDYHLRRQNQKTGIDLILPAYDTALRG